MPICRRRAPRKTAFCVDPNLELKALVRLPLFEEHSMEESRPERTSGTTCVHACATLTLSPAPPIQMCGRGPPRKAMVPIDMLLQTDDALVVSDNAEQVLRNELGRHFTLKEESIGPPKMHLGGHVRKVQLENGVECWAFSSSQYVQAAVKNVEEYLSKKDNVNWKLPAKAETPMQTSYRPEIDVSPELQPIDAAYYMSLIGMLRWIVELGRVDVCLECSMLSSHLAMPREGHLYQLFQVFAYLKKYHNTEMVYDPSDPCINESEFELRDWTSSEFGHIEGKEELPPNMPTPRGRGFVINAKVDADHASDTVTRRSRTGFFVYLNCAPVYWLSKKQTSCESSSFGSEFVAMKQCCEYLRGLRYKLRMMGTFMYYFCSDLQ